MIRYRVVLPNSSIHRRMLTYVFPLINALLIILVVFLVLTKLSPLLQLNSVPDLVLLRWICGVVFLVVYLWQVQYVKRHYDSQIPPDVVED